MSSIKSITIKKFNYALIIIKLNKKIEKQNNFSKKQIKIIIIKKNLTLITKVSIR